MKQIELCQEKYNHRLGIITHVPHWINGDGIPICYEPYAREIRIWADLFTHVDVLAPRGEGDPQKSLAAYGRPNITWCPVNYPNDVGLIYTLRRAILFFPLSLHVIKFIQTHNVIQPRSPGHLGFLGNLFSRILNKPSITKWAGYFGYYKGERLTSIIERVLLSLPSKTNKVLVYGKARKKHFISFIPALMNSEEISYAEQITDIRKWMSMKITFLSVGRLLSVKDFDLAVRGLGELEVMNPSLDWEFLLVGDGDQRSYLEELCHSFKISNKVKFLGSLPFSKVQKMYATAHYLIMPGTREGWPKTIGEAWAHYCIPICVSSCLVPEIIQDGINGFLFNADPKSFAEVVSKILKLDNEYLMAFAQKSHNQVNELSMDNFKTRLQMILKDVFA
jgi:glycosyltransferase involved in cell wall biosynthesis